MTDKLNDNDKKKTVRVQWSIQADVECPHCNSISDFMDIDEFWVFSNVGENVEKFHRPIEIHCVNCKKEFLIDGADY